MCNSCVTPADLCDGGSYGCLESAQSLSVWGSQPQWKKVGSALKRCPHSLTASRASLRGRTAGGSGCEQGALSGRETTKISCYCKWKNYLEIACECILHLLTLVWLQKKQVFAAIYALYVKKKILLNKWKDSKHENWSNINIWNYMYISAGKL